MLLNSIINKVLNIPLKIQHRKPSPKRNQKTLPQFQETFLPFYNQYNYHADLHL